jgi:hypothetical protein
VPRYFFHMKSKDTRIADHNGKELTCIQAAHMHAQQLIRKTVLYLQPNDSPEGWSIDICDAEGSSELVVLFPPRVSALMAEM